MSFASPFILWGLLLIPMALLAYWLVQRRRIKYAARFTNLDLLANVVDASPGRRRHIPALLALASLAALVVAMARPQAVVAVPRDDATVVLTMDSSASMTATDVPPTGSKRPSPLRTSFLDGLRSGSGSASSRSPARSRSSRSRRTTATRSGRPSTTIQGDVGTALGDAIVTSVGLAPDRRGGEASGGKPLFAVLLLSDGANSTGSEPLTSGRPGQGGRRPDLHDRARHRRQGTVEITNDYGETETYNVPPDPETLKQVAEETGGRFFEAPTQADLEAVYEEIGSQVSTENEERELTAIFAGAGRRVPAARRQPLRPVVRADPVTHDDERG